MPLDAHQLIAEFSKHDWYISGRASERLAALGPQAVEPLVVALSDPDGYVRAGAAAALGDIGDHRAFEPLLQAARNTGSGWTEDGENTEAQVQAVVALEKLGDRRAVPILLKLLERAVVDNHCLAWYVIDALGALGDGSLASLLTPLLNHGDIDVRKSAAAALKRVAVE